MVEISVIIPVYNAEKYLNKCFDSVLSQEFQDFEILVVNDGSTDGSVNILKEYLQKYPEKFFYMEKENGGLSSARNLALDNAHGKYITFLDSDDYISKDYLWELYKEAEKYNSEMVVSGQFKVEENGTVVDHIVYQPDKNGNSLMRRLNISGKLYKREFVEQNKIRFPLGKTYEDNPFNLKAYFLAKNLRFLNYAGYHQVIHEGSITSKKIEYNLLPIEALNNTVYYVENKRDMVNDLELFEFTVMSFFTYFIFVRNKKKEYLSTNNRKSDMDVVLHVCDDFQEIVKKNFLKYTKNKYCSVFKNNELQLSQKIGTKVFAWLIKTNMLKAFTRIYYRI